MNCFNVCRIHVDDSWNYVTFEHGHYCVLGLAESRCSDHVRDLAESDEVLVRVDLDYDALLVKSRSDRHHVRTGDRYLGSYQLYSFDLRTSSPRCLAAYFLEDS